MTKMGLSDAVLLVWRIAAQEAADRGREFIDPEHLFAALCCLERAFSPSLRKDLEVSEAALAEIRSEWERVGFAFREANVDRLALRRKLRAGSSDVQRPLAKNRSISRSAAARSVFERADKISRDNGEEVVTLVPFFLALLDAESGTLESLQKLVGDLADLSRMRDSLISLNTSRRILSFGPQSSDSRLSKKTLQTAPNVEAPQPRIRKTLDATLPVFDNPRQRPASRDLALFYEVPWQLGRQSSLESMLQQMIERLVRTIQDADRGAVLLQAPSTGELLLIAHVPLGSPSVSLTLAQRAIASKRGFIWNQEQDMSVSQQVSRTQAGIYAPLLWNDEVFGVICLDSPSTNVSFSDGDLALVVCIGHQMALAVANFRLHRELQHTADLLQRLLTSFSPKLRNRLLDKARHGRLHLGGERSEVTVLLSDIRGFTNLSARMDTSDVVDMLNEYFSALSNVIFRYDGTIDKFIGDAILAVFGSPEPDAHQYEHALRAATDMQATMAALNESRSVRGEQTCEIGIGIHCGEVLHGFIGASERMEFTIIGDTVNRSSRYGDAAAGGQILISPELHQRVWRMVEARQLLIPTKHEGNLSAFSVQSLKIIKGT